MTYGSICSGIEAATVAWHPLGWKPAFFAEIEPFPCSVLKHHYPEVPNLGDFTQIQPGDADPIDILVGGTPCQSFSIAGKRLGLDDPRGNLTLEWLRLVQRILPRWLVWENVPGVLSDDGGRTFGTILGTLAKLGYGFAYRVLDAQFFGLAQRRKRVFIVGCLGDWRAAAAVLFESESVSGHPAPSREAGAQIAALTSNGVGTCGADDNQAQAGHLIAHALNAKGGAGRIDGESETFVVHGRQGPITSREQPGPLDCDRGSQVIAFNMRGRDGGAQVELAPGNKASLRSVTGGASRSLVCFDKTQITSAANYSNPQPGDPSHPIPAHGRAPTIAFAAASGVRRLTPRECERLMGFQDVQKTAIISVWDSPEKARNCAAAETRSLKLQSSVLHAEGQGSRANAGTVVGNSNTHHLGREKPVDLSVLINLERAVVAIHRTGRLLWSASTAAARNESPLRMPVGDFVQFAAPMLQTLEAATLGGGAESRTNTSGFSLRQSGRKSVSVCGQEIDELAADADRFTREVNRFTKSITSLAGPNSPICEQLWIIWSCCVVHAISSCIPEEIRGASSYTLSVAIEHGYTLVPHRGKPAADGPRYKALGNSMAVPCMRWIGERIAFVDALEAVA